MAAFGGATELYVRFPKIVVGAGICVSGYRERAGSGGREHLEALGAGNEAGSRYRLGK